MSTRTNIAPPWAGGGNVLGALRRGLPRIRAAVEAWLRRACPGSASAERLSGHLLHDIGLEAGGDQGAHAVPFRLPRQL